MPSCRSFRCCWCDFLGFAGTRRIGVIILETEDNLLTLLASVSCLVPCIKQQPDSKPDGKKLPPDTPLAEIMQVATQLHSAHAGKTDAGSS